MESETEATMRGGREGSGAERRKKVMRGRRIVPRINGNGERGIELWKTSLLESIFLI